ncbi:uncharacterized protein LOC125553187 isoform X2 [Triticum urartu]|uniref:uncharacterized protein LOC119287361 isoform X2 n=1 Tax=Triticum dicoccoides TaxID=85692 RepID=UPI00188F6E7F|nr:uncharacterized protein LOC119287361 isoform X2 [Triticum dicoccoides]XP_048572936.1 uncharacterized protein LOC125553187 isoform X2 [Triticum urartu]
MSHRICRARRALFSLFFGKVYSVFLLSAATISTWSAPMSCRSSAQRVRSASRSTASPTQWWRSCSHLTCSPMRCYTRSSRSTPAGPPSRSTTLTGLLNSPCPRTQPKLLGLASALSYLEVLVSFRDRRLRCYGSAPTTYQMIMMLMLSEVLDQLCYVLISNTNHCLVHEPKCAAAPYTYRIGYGVSQNTDSKMCSAFLINAATVSRWSAMTSCQSSAQRFWSATRSVASPTWWCRFCGRSMCPSKRSMCSPTRRSSSGSMSTQAGSPPRSSTSTSSSSKGVTSQLVCIYEDCSLVSAFPCPTIMAQNFETICCSTRTW